MRVWTNVCAVMVAVAVSGSALAAECVSFTKSVAYPGLNPNRAAVGLAGSGDTYIVARHEARTDALYVARLDNALDQVTPDALVANGTRVPAHVVATGTDFGVFYQRADASVFFQQVSTSGALVGSPLMLRQGDGPQTTLEYDVRWDATRGGYLFVYNAPQGAERGLWLATLERNGAVRGKVLVTPHSAAILQPLVASASNGNALVFYRDALSSKYAVQAYDPNGSLAGYSIVGSPSDFAAVATSGTVIALFTSVDVPGGSEIHWTRVNASGEVTGREARVFAAKGIAAAPVWAVWNNDDKEFALAYLDSLIGFRDYPGDLRLARFKADGTIVYDTFLSPDASKAALQTLGSMIWDGSSYVTPIGRVVSYESGFDSYLTRNCTLRASVTPASSYVPLLATTSFTAQATGGVGPYTYKWDMGDYSLPKYGSNVTYRYVRPDSYTVTVTVTDVNGAVVNVSTVVRVDVPKRRAVGR